MKIAQITTFFHPITGGVETHVLSLARALKAKSYDVEVLTTDSNKGRTKIKERSTKYLGIEVRRFRTLISFSYFHKFAPGMFFYLLRSDADIFHVHGFRKVESYFALFAGKLRKKKVVLTTHNPFPTETRSSRLNMLVRIHDKTFGKWFTRYFDKIIALVDSEKQILKEQFNVEAKKLQVIPNGIEDEYLEPGSKDQFLKDWNIDRNKWDAIVVGVGRINYVKGFQNLELAAKKLKNVLFFFSGGDDGYLKKLKFIYNKYPNIYFTERFVAREKLKDVYQAADIFVFPSLHEAFGIAPFESMLQETPVISTNVGGPQEIFNEDVAILLPPTDQEAWKDAIEDLVKNEKKRKKLATNAKEFAQKFLWSKVVRRLENTYKNLLETKDDISVK